MSDVTRYTISDRLSGPHGLIFGPGEYVKAADYDALAARLAEAERERDEATASLERWKDGAFCVYCGEPVLCDGDRGRGIDGEELAQRFTEHAARCERHPSRIAEARAEQAERERDEEREAHEYCSNEWRRASILAGTERARAEQAERERDANYELTCGEGARAERLAGLVSKLVYIVVGGYPSSDYAARVLREARAALADAPEPPGWTDTKVERLAELAALAGDIHEVAQWPEDQAKSALHAIRELLADAGPHADPAPCQECERLRGVETAARRVVDRWWREGRRPDDWLGKAVGLLIDALADAPEPTPCLECERLAEAVAKWREWRGGQTHACSPEEATLYDMPFTAALADAPEPKPDRPAEEPEGGE